MRLGAVARCTTPEKTLPSTTAASAPTPLYVENARASKLVVQAGARARVFVCV